MKSLILSFTLFSSILSFGQHNVFVSDAETIVNDLLLGSSNVEIVNIEFTGYPDALGVFSGQAYYVPFDFAMVMTTGNVYSAQGPNDEDIAGGNNYSTAHSQVENLLSIEEKDIAKLIIDFIPTGDKISLEYVFGTEESDLSAPTYNDIVGIFLTGPNAPGNNLALFPTTQDYVSSKNLYLTQNSANTVFNGNPDTPPYNIDPNYVQYNRLTKPLKAEGIVIPGETYRIEIGIADALDGISDSGIFIKAGSLTSSIKENGIGAEINLYPNPTSDYLNIELSQELENCYLNIYNSSGHLVLTQPVLQHSNISLSEFSTGMYTIELKSNYGVSYQKITKI